MKKILVYLFTVGLLALGSSFSAKAQYRNALGVRIGDFSGVTFKTFIDPSDALDFSFGFRNTNSYNAVKLTGLYEIHDVVNAELPGLFWYYGGGMSLGGIDYKLINENKFLFSADGVIGLDYKFDGAPINLSFDWKPALQVAPDTDFKAGQFGLSVRITF